MSVAHHSRHRRQTVRHNRHCTRPTVSVIVSQLPGTPRGAAVRRRCGLLPLTHQPDVADGPSGAPHSPFSGGERERVGLDGTDGRDGTDASRDVGMAVRNGPVPPEHRAKAAAGAPRSALSRRGSDPRDRCPQLVGSFHRENELGDTFSRAMGPEDSGICNMKTIPTMYVRQNNSIQMTNYSVPAT